jgi:hypothetical protein
MSQSRRTQIAILTGAAIMAVGALTAAIEQEKASHAAPTYLSGVSEMTLGDTETATSPPTAAPVSVASPGDKATVPCGFTDGC